MCMGVHTHTRTYTCGCIYPCTVSIHVSSVCSCGYVYIHKSVDVWGLGLSAYILHMCACLQMYVNKGTYVHGCMYTYMHGVDLHM